jgi:uncharacterized protein Yka (UPF0111/DUF47 family)
MKRKLWFLPESPDILGMLLEQATITVEGLEALSAWAAGDADAAERLRAAEHRADDKKRELRLGLTQAFTTPLEPEDLFELSVGVDDVLNSAKNAVREAEVMGTSSDAAIAEMAEQLTEGGKALVEAIDALRRHDHTAATAAADRAVTTERKLEHAYRRAMSSLVELDNLREVAARRELYRRLARTGDRIVGVAERVWYAVLKQS